MENDNLSAMPNAPEGEEEQPLDPAAERVRRKLVRFMVINLAILFAALMAVVLAFVYKSLPARDGRVPPAASPSDPAPSGELFDGEIVLPTGTRVVAHTTSGNWLSLHLRMQDGSEAIHIYRIDTGELTGRFSLVQGNSR